MTFYSLWTKIPKNGHNGRSASMASIQQPQPKANRPEIWTFFTFWTKIHNAGHSGRSASMASIQQPRPKANRQDGRRWPQTAHHVAGYNAGGAAPARRWPSATGVKTVATLKFLATKASFLISKKIGGGWEWGLLQERSF